MKVEETGVITAAVTDQLQKLADFVGKLLPTAKEAIGIAHKSKDSDKAIAELEDNIDEVIIALAPVKQILLIGKLKFDDPTISKMDYLKTVTARLVLPMKRLHEKVQIAKAVHKNCRSSKDTSSD